MAAYENAELVKHYEYVESLVDRVSRRRQKQDMSIHEPNPSWPAQYQEFKRRIEDALGPKILEIYHVGSTSIPNMPAKNNIDIDLGVADPKDEKDFIPALEAAGFHFLSREPHWHDHRFLVAYKPMPCNLHVFAANCPETKRHLMFRQWIIDNPAEKELYTEAKRTAAAATAHSDSGMAYNLKKETVVREILDRMLKAKGLL